MAEDNNKKIIWIVVALVVALVVLPLLIVAGAGAIAFLTFQETVESAETARDEAEAEAIRREAEWQHAAEEAEEARRAAEEARQQQVQPAGESDTPSDDPLEGL